jgi:hypothetical protein
MNQSDYRRISPRKMLLAALRVRANPSVAAIDANCWTSTVAAKTVAAMPVSQSSRIGEQRRMGRLKQGSEPF